MVFCPIHLALHAKTNHLILDYGPTVVHDQLAAKLAFLVGLRKQVVGIDQPGGIVVNSIADGLKKLLFEGVGHAFRGVWQWKATCRD